MPDYNPPNAFYTQISVPDNIKPEVFIGKEGCHLKRITELSGCEYLWYDFNRNVVEVWGKEHRLPKALKMLRKRIASFDDEILLDDSKIKVRGRKEGGFYHYTIEGSEEHAMKYFLGTILSEYPTNPYMTMIMSKKDGKMAVKRMTSCS